MAKRRRKSGDRLMARLGATLLLLGAAGYALYWAMANASTIIPIVLAVLALVAVLMWRPWSRWPMRHSSAARQETPPTSRDTERPQPIDDWPRVVGESNYQEAIGRIAGGKTPYGAARYWGTATLVSEPDNPFDSSAVKVVIEDSLVGYLAREDAARITPVLKYAESIGSQVSCKAWITGGWDRGGGDTGYFGIALWLDSPETLLRRLEARGHGARAGR